MFPFCLLIQKYLWDHFLPCRTLPSLVNDFSKSLNLLLGAMGRKSFCFRHLGCQMPISHSFHCNFLHDYSATSQGHWKGRKKRERDKDQKKKKESSKIKIKTVNRSMPTCELKNTPFLIIIEIKCLFVIYFCFFIINYFSQRKCSLFSYFELRAT